MATQRLSGRAARSDSPWRTPILYVGGRLKDLMNPAQNRVVVRPGKRSCGLLQMDLEEFVIIGGRGRGHTAIIAVGECQASENSTT